MELPHVLQPNVMRQMHERWVGGHFAVERTVAWLQTRYDWYRMREAVALWCRTCISYASKARPLKMPRAPMGTVRVVAPHGTCCRHEGVTECDSVKIIICL